jgi:hypothetical protein
MWGIFQSKVITENKGKLLALGIAIAMLLLSTLCIATIYGETVFHRDTGGFSPDIWVVKVGVDNAKGYMKALLKAADGEVANASAALSNTTKAETKSSSHNLLLSVPQEIKWLIVMYMFSVFIHTMGQVYQKMPITGTKFFPVAPTGRTFTTTGLLTMVLLASGAWMPAIHTPFCVFASLVLSPVDPDIHFREVARGSFAKESKLHNYLHQPPNIIYVIPDSLSGKILLNSKEAKQATPFFQSLRGRDDLYVFENARSVSGSTQDGFTSLMTGCLPVTESGRKMAFENSIGTEFRAMGYQTFSSSSDPLEMAKTPWYMIQNFLEKNMDKVVDPVGRKLPSVNDLSSDDRALFPFFARWLREEITVDDPFYAQLYLLNTHWPYLKDANSTQQHRYVASLETFDETLLNLFNLLNETGKLDNTIVVLSSDHGDHLGPTVYKRLTGFNDNILGVAMFMYVPKHLIHSEDARELLRYNTNQTTSVLDVYPTLQNFLYGGRFEETASLRNEMGAADTTSQLYRDRCLTGMDLLGFRVPENRLAVSWNKISNMHPGKGHLLSAFSGKDRGIFMKRKGGPASPSTFREINYSKDCLSLFTDDCEMELSSDRRLYWQRVLGEMPIFSDSAMEILIRRWSALWDDSERSVSLRGHKYTPFW